MMAKMNVVVSQCGGTLTGIGTTGKRRPESQQRNADLEGFWFKELLSQSVLALCLIFELQCQHRTIIRAFDV